MIFKHYEIQKMMISKCKKKYKSEKNAKNKLKPKILAIYKTATLYNLAFGIALYIFQIKQECIHHVSFNNLNGHDLGR